MQSGKLKTVVAHIQFTFLLGKIILQNILVHNNHKNTHGELLLSTVLLFLANMVLANQNAKLTSPDQGFLFSPLVRTRKPWEQSCSSPPQRCGQFYSYMEVTTALFTSLQNYYSSDP
jgi:hypothetical protein